MFQLAAVGREDGRVLPFDAPCRSHESSVAGTNRFQQGVLGQGRRHVDDLGFVRPGSRDEQVGRRPQLLDVVQLAEALETEIGPGDRLGDADAALDRTLRFGFAFEVDHGLFEPGPVLCLDRLALEFTDLHRHPIHECRTGTQRTLPAADPSMMRRPLADGSGQKLPR